MILLITPTLRRFIFGAPLFFCVGFAVFGQVHAKEADQPISDLSGSKAFERYPETDIYKVTALLELDHGGAVEMYAGLIDQQSGHSFLISTRKKRNGLELVSVDLDRQVVVLRNEDGLFLAAMVENTQASLFTSSKFSHLRAAVVGVRNPRETTAAERRRLHYEQHQQALHRPPIEETR